MPDAVVTYPALITVFCDECGKEESRDFLVAETDSAETRFGYARAYLEKEKGWLIIPDHLDLCDTCSFC